MSDSNTLRYKQITRQARIQTREGNFSGGMFFTNKPLTTGYNKLLVNYDIDPTDGTLRPRRGLQSKVVLTPPTYLSEDWLNVADAAPHILDSNVRNYVSEAGEQQRLLSTLAYEPLTDSAYMIESTDPSAILDNDPNSAYTDNTNKDGSKVFGQLNYLTAALSQGKARDINNPTKCIYDDYYQLETTTVTDPEIHGHRCAPVGGIESNNLYFKKPVGTFAFGDAYYFFSHLQYTLQSPFATLENPTITYTVSGAPTLYPCLDLEQNIIFPGYADTSGTVPRFYRYTGSIPANSTLTLDISQTRNANEDYYNPTVSTVTINLPADGVVSINTFMKAFYNALKKNELSNQFDLSIRKEQYLGYSCLLNTSFKSMSSNNDSGALFNTEYTLYAYRTALDIKALVYETSEAPNNPTTVVLTEPPELHYIKKTRLSTDTIARHRNNNLSIQYATDTTNDYIITPQTQNPSEAASAGYNMLLEDPYAFACETGANINILGILPYIGEQLSLTPIINRALTFKCFYRAPLTNKEYRVVWEWREVGATTWNTIKDEKIDFSTLNLTPLTCDFRSAVEQLILRVTISDPSNKVTQSDGTEIEYVEATTALGLNFVITTTSSKQNIQPTKYTLGTATGMLEWKNRLVLWGVENAKEMLFTSDVNNPSFFPYPNNVDVLDEAIVHCMLYGDDLIVFTTTKLYRLTFDETGITWTRTLIQKDLQISEKDIPMFCRIKNMLLFKSGNYYYMLVPSSSSISGETTIAPISNVMKEFLDNFVSNVQNVFKIISLDLEPMYSGSKITDYLCDYYAYADNQSIVLNYVYDINSYYSNSGMGDPILEYSRMLTRYWTISLIYDTSAYTWRIHTMIHPRICKPIITNTLAQKSFMHIIPYKNPLSTNDYSPVFVYDILDTTVQDNCITYAEYTTSSNEEGLYYDYLNPYNVADEPILLKNYQYLDTGYRILTASVDLKKRFREMQFSINNVSQKALTFYTAFLLDGQLRRDMQGYNTKVILDPTDPRTGILLVERPYIDPKYLPSVPEFTVSITDYINPNVTPGDTTLDDSFVLDNTKFPDLAYWKVRVSVSGKGYVPCLQLLSVNDLDYNILSTNWAYRTMNAR